MAAAKGPAKNSQPSIKFQWGAVESKSIKVVEFVLQEKRGSKVDKSKTKQLLSTAVLISAVDQIWDDVFQPKEKTNASLKEEILDNLDRGCRPKAQISADKNGILTDLKTPARSPSTQQAKLEFPRVTEKLGFFYHNNQNYSQTLLQMFLPCDASSVYKSWKENLLRTERSFGMENMYGWMEDIVPTATGYCMKGTEVGVKKTCETHIPVNKENVEGECASGKAVTIASHLAVADTECCSTFIESNNQQSSKTSEFCTDTGSASLSGDYLLTAVQDSLANDGGHYISSSQLLADYHNNISSLKYKAIEEFEHITDSGDLFEENRIDSQTQIYSSSSNKVPKYALAKQEHAFAGALAGISVSLCLHPLDTVKTIIQSCRAENKSLYYLGKTIVTERGLAGLYRGIASNLASSAPISALYTFTYETAKKALLPLFPKEYCSLAHCIAGGSASVATSFIFTPSERIKQQMQVGAHYKNCWNAFAEIIKKGGLCSLYTGWGAVLCRNVPHSIIKFYAYESLKQMMLSPLEPGVQPNTLQTLVCGGLAGSTAAFFTTPFDVVKTRLQTQIPGSMNQYGNVFQALQEISKQEGLRGLYRGLIPRLVMYISQGALFFASYEFFKSILCSELPELSPSRMQHIPNEEEESASCEHQSTRPSTSLL